MKRILLAGLMAVIILGLTGCWLIPNDPPVARFYANPTSGPAPLTVTFNASASYDPDGTIKRYYWEFGDGTTGRGRIVTHTYTRPGVYTPFLTVTDNRGAEATVNGVRITVTEPNKPPVAYYEAYWYDRERLIILLDPRRSYDPDGYIVEYRWNIAGRVFVYTRPYVLKVQFCCPGNYTISLTVKDNKGATSTYRRTWRIYPNSATLQTTSEEGIIAPENVVDVSETQE